MLFKSGTDVNHGWSSLNFSKGLISNKTLYALIAHELGHNYLEWIVPTLRGLSIKAFH
jgi:hypothetical protein